MGKPRTGSKRSVSYRITGWTGLPGAHDRLEFRKVLAAMSVGPVSRRWLTRESGLSRKEIDSLLSALEAQGVLKVEPQTTKPRAEATPASQRDRPGALARLLGFFRRPVKLQGKGLSIEVVLAKPDVPSAPQAPAASGMFAGLPPHELQLITAKLNRLLAHHPDARRVLPHLAVFEHTLRRRGTAAADELPLHVLRAALSQLQSLGHRSNENGLGQLRARLALALLRREEIPEAAAASRDAPRSDILVPGRLEVNEVGLSMFMDADRIWQPPLPTGESAPKPSGRLADPAPSATQARQERLGNVLYPRA